LEQYRGTTILSVRRGDKVVIGGDGQVSLGNTVMKGNARKVRRLYKDKVIAGFAGASWNSYEEYLLIRNSDAHAWAEIYDGNGNWVRFDPTPAVGSLSASAQAEAAGLIELDGEARGIAGCDAAGQCSALIDLDHAVDGEGGPRMGEGQSEDGEDPFR